MLNEVPGYVRETDRLRYLSLLTICEILLVRLMNYSVAARVWTVIVAVLLLLPGSLFPSSDSSWLDPLLEDLLATLTHLVLFFVHAWLLRSLFARAGFVEVLSAAVIVSTLYAALLELAQIPITGRGFELIDIAAGALGAFLGAWLASGPLRRWSDPV